MPHKLRYGVALCVGTVLQSTACATRLSTSATITVTCSSFKKRAPRAIREIKKFAQKLLGTEVRFGR